MAHVLDYAPSPHAVVYSPEYGRQPLWYCGKGCCHGPHMYEELWVGPASGDPTDIQGWRRPYRDMQWAPHDIWLMANPVEFDGNHIWVDNGKVWGVKEHRLGGVYAPANGEFSTAPFELPLTPLWLEVAVSWQGGNHVGVPEGADEGHQAYAMVELSEHGSGKVVAESDKCVITNIDGRVTLRWANKTSDQLGVAPGTLLSARIFFRGGVVHALGG